MACLTAVESPPGRFAIWPPSRSYQRNASARASASSCALRLPQNMNSASGRHRSVVVQRYRLGAGGAQTSDQVRSARTQLSRSAGAEQLGQSLDQVTEECAVEVAEHLERLVRTAEERPQRPAELGPHEPEQ